MNINKSFKELKELSKEQLLGNYGVLSGTSFIVMAIFYALFFLIYFAVFGTTLTSIYIANPSADVRQVSLMINLLFFVLQLIITALMSVMTIGLLYMTLEISRGRSVKIKDVFFCFTHHPDKVLIIFFVSFFASFIFSLPASIMSYYYSYTTPDKSIFTSDYCIPYLVLYLIGIIAQIIISLNLALSYFLYLDKPEYTAMECIKESYLLMKENKLRLFLFMLSFAGWILLLVVSCCIAIFWILPYLYISFCNFYRDLINDHPTLDITIDDQYESKKE